MKCRILLVASASLLGACGGVNHVLRPEVRQPATIAVLPFAGPADAPTREATRALLQSRLLARGYRLPETSWVDRVLTERGWLRDPAAFDPSKLRAPEVAEALGVDAIAIGSEFDETRWNFVVLRRHSFGGKVAVQGDDGVWWSTNHGAGSYGGFLLTSGQVFEELRAQGNHGTPMATLALVDEFVADVSGTIPVRQPVDRTTDPVITDVTTRRVPGTEGERVIVESHATPGCSLRADLSPGHQGVPMAALPDEPGRYRGTHELPAGTMPASITVYARTAFGRETRLEVKP